MKPLQRSIIHTDGRRGACVYDMNVKRAADAGLGGPVQNTNNKRQHCKVVHTCTLGGEEGDAKKNERQSLRVQGMNSYKKEINYV